MDVDSLYQEIILDHYKHPHGAGLREPFEAEVHHVNPTCGDEITLRVHLDGEMVSDVSYAAEGCSISRASTSVLNDLIVGKSVSEGMAVLDEFNQLMHGKGKIDPNEDVLEDGIAFAGVAQFPGRIKCALLGWMAWKDAVSQALVTTASSDTASSDTALSDTSSSNEGTS
ncbi:Fe-S cluster assembly sulfur transfer protein SufU [Aeromicrobium sp.]|uniref:Fe-S cluster assembly sulfur transfer protein SufU n=1 Tax=Aeromicrobium sp. TaxID=1871063 RepID=UPI001987E71B|nr:SUF system NifU family Fe-S cluster assembly protein [Aeromicrobium sp.]MBC7629860.1 SUF system NifU family Fe-S cluster assembly protein [Aeromicrobium sp.]